MYHLLVHIGWVDLDFEYSIHCLPSSASADSNLAEAAEKHGKIVEYPDQSLPNPAARAKGTPCKYVVPQHSCSLQIGFYRVVT